MPTLALSFLVANAPAQGAQVSSVNIILPPFWANPWFWISLGVAVVSVCVSLYALFVTHLSPFSLTVLPGRPRWRRETIGTGGPGGALLTLTLPILFVNTGAQGGQIRDVRIEILWDTNRLVYRPRFFADPEKSLHVEGKSSLELSQSDFHPFALTGREQRRQVIVFTPQGPAPTAPPSTHKLGLLIYSASLRGENPRRTPFHVGTFVIPSEAERALETGNLIIPTSEEDRRAWDAELR
jgi:hypothetical protein